MLGAAPGKILARGACSTRRVHQMLDLLRARQQIGVDDHIVLVSHGGFECVPRQTHRFRFRRDVEPGCFKRSSCFRPQSWRILMRLKPCHRRGSLSQPSPYASDTFQPGDLSGCRLSGAVLRSSAFLQVIEFLLLAKPCVRPKYR